MPVEFSSNKKLESLSPRDVLKTGEVFARFEKVQISEISLPEKLDNNLLDELVELFKEEDPDVDTGLAIAGLEDEKVVYKAITSPKRRPALKVMLVEEF